MKHPSIVLTFAGIWSFLIFAVEKQRTPKVSISESSGNVNESMLHFSNA